jgi:hypothetical protein
VLIALLTGWRNAAAFQSLDIVKERFNDSVRVVPPEGILSPENIATMRRFGVKLPDSLAVGRENGVSFLYRRNGVALISNDPDADWTQISRKNAWAVDCAKDAMDDHVTCQLGREGITLVATGGTHSLLIGSQLRPGSQVGIRVDQDAAVWVSTPGFAADEADRIVSRMKTGHTVTVRYRRIDRDENTDVVIDLYGFPEALKFMDWEMTRYK